jgi:hypothetical protein
MKWARVASVFVRSAAKRSHIEAAFPVRKSDALAVVRRCFGKALITISCSRINRRRNNRKVRSHPKIESS